MDRLQQTARKQTRQLARITAVGLDPITRTLRHQPRRHHLAVDAALDQVALQTKAGRARLVTAAHHRPAPQHLLDRLMVVGQRPLLEQLVRAHRCQPDRARVNVQPDRYRRRRVVHGRRPPYVALPDPLRQPTTDAQAPTTLRRQPDAAADRATAPSCLRTRVKLRPQPAYCRRVGMSGRDPPELIPCDLRSLLLRPRLPRSSLAELGCTQRGARKRARRSRLYLRTLRRAGPRFEARQIEDNSGCLAALDPLPDQQCQRSSTGWCLSRSR